MARGDLVGRLEERALLRALIAQRGSALIAGPSGVGKTRLAQEVQSDAQAAGLTTLWVTATRSSRTIPFGALSVLLNGDVLDAGGAMSPAAVLAKLGVRQGAAGALPDLIIIDDGHMLDDASATLVLQLASSAGSSMLLTLTWGVEPPDAIAALWKEGTAQRVELQPLSRAETDALVAEMLGGTCDALTFERLWRATEGNALYVRELLDAARSGGRLSLHRGQWHLESGGDMSGPLVGLVAARIDRLDPRVRRVLEVVALAAPVSLRLLESVVDLEAVAAAEEAGVVEVVTDRDRTVARAAHPMHVEVARAVLPGARRRALCRQLADSLETIGIRRRNDLLRFLTWRLDAGDGAPVELLLRGAWQASGVGDMRLAERLARAAVAIAPRHHAARLALADAIYRQARHGDALTVLAESDAESDREHTELVVARAKATWGLGRLDEAESIVLEAASTVRDRDCLGWLQGFRATLRAALGFPLDSVALAQEIADNPTYGARTRLSGLGSLALASAFAGRCREAVAAAQRGSEPELLAAAESRTLLSWVEPALWTAAWLSGDLEQAHLLADAYRTSGLETRDSERVAGGSMGVGWAALMRGELGPALAGFEDAIALAPVDDRIGIKTIALIGTSWAHAWRGDTVAAAAALDEADAASTAGARWFDPCATVGRAWIAATDGDERTARRLFERAADDSERRGLLPYAICALHGLARLDRAGAVNGRLSALADRVDGPLAPIIAAHADALASDNPAALEDCSVRFEQLGMWLLAAECAAAEARTRDARSEVSNAEVARARCGALLRKVGDCRPITLLRLTTSSPLSARERQIARLAAAGASSREIAEKLDLSARTVDSHLAHVYTKLGIGGRHDLVVTTFDDPFRATSNS